MNTALLTLGDPLLTVLWMLVAITAIIFLELSYRRRR